MSNKKSISISKKNKKKTLDPLRYSKFYSASLHTLISKENNKKINI